MGQVGGTTDRSGQIVGSRYRLLKIIGHGGQGVVYEALDLKDGDQVAVKVLADRHWRDPDARERMFREARAMTELAGTHAVRVFDQVWNNNLLCLVMELLEGEELDDYLKRAEAAGYRMDPGLLVQLIDPVVDTLDKAHDLGIVHRDLKPGNIYLLSPRLGGGVRVLDFGFAKFMRMRGFTASGVIAGSPHYIAPEAWMGRKDLDQRIDVYALGAIVFRCLGGRTPFPDDGLANLLRAVTRNARPSLRALRPDLPEEVDEWVAQALAIEPDERFIGVRGMWAAFKGCAGL